MTYKLFNCHYLLINTTLNVKHYYIKTVEHLNKSNKCIKNDVGENK